MNDYKQISTIVTSRWDRIDAKMEEYVNQRFFPGFVTLVYQHGQIVHENCCGMMDIEAGKPMRKDTIFRIYSMSKPITCTALMMLFEEGKFFLDEPVFPYIPGFKNLMVCTGQGGLGLMLEPAMRPITFRHLLTHTAGLGYGFFLVQ